MDTTSTIKVLPIYGYGWVICGNPRFDEPKPFTVQLDCSELKRWSGIVLDEGHEFQGQRVELSQRHVSWTGDVNIVVKPLDPSGEPSTGFGTLTRLPSLAKS